MKSESDLLRGVLVGAGLTRDVECLLSAIRSVRGAISVEHLLNVHERPKDVPVLQGAS